MKLFAKNTIIFIVGLIFVVILPIIYISNYDNLDKHTSQNHNIISLQTKSEHDSLDILFIGNSYCYSSVNTFLFDSLKIEIFNLGIATSGVQFYKLVLNDYLNNINSQPKKIMILVSPMTFSSRADNFIAYPIHRYLEDEKTNFEISISYNRLDQIFTMYKKSFKKGIINILSVNDENIIKERTNNKGYSPSYEIINKETVKNREYLYLPLKKDKFEMSKVNELLAIVKNESIVSDILFFEVPTNHLNHYFSSKYLSDYKIALNKLKYEFPLIQIDSSQFSQMNYRNIDHMNNSGAIITTNEIIKKIF